MKKLSTNNFTTKLGFIEKQFDWSKRYYCMVDILNSDFENLELGIREMLLRSCVTKLKYEATQ